MKRQEGVIINFISLQHKKSVLNQKAITIKRDMGQPCIIIFFIYINELQNALKESYTHVQLELRDFKRREGIRLSLIP